MGNTPIFSLFQIGNSLHHLNKKAERDFGLSLMQWGVLKRLIDMPATPAATLAKAVGVHPSTLTQTLRRLERKKYIFSTDDPKDSRKKMISITREGRDIYESASERIERWSGDIRGLSLEIDRIQSCLKNQMDKIF